MSDKLDLDSEFWLEQWRVQPDRNRISGPGGDVHLPPRTMAVLMCLAEHAGEVVTRDEFSNAVWHPSVVSDYALTQCISELRGHLGDRPGNCRFIETIPKKGYRLKAPVTLHDPGESAQTDPDAGTALDVAIAAGQKTSRLRQNSLGVVLLVSALLTAWIYWPDGPSPAAPASPNGIAVLPFENLSPDPDHAFFASGMHEEVLTSLSHIDDLRVISRSSVHAVAKEELTVLEIGTRLDVSHVLEGSVRRSGDRVRVTVQLIEAATDDHLWAENYDRDLRDIFAIQSEIAFAIADQLEANLDPEVMSRLAEQGTNDPAAYELYLEGRELLRQGWSSTSSRQDIRARVDQIEDLFRAAIEQDPEFADAHAALSYALLYSLRARSAEEAEARYLAAVESSRRAIRLEPNLAFGYLTLGKAYYFNGDMDAAWEQFRLAADIDPDDPRTLRHMYLVLRDRGEFVECVKVARRTAALEPNVPGHQNRLAFIYLLLGDTDRARDTFQMPDTWGSRLRLAEAAWLDADWDAMRTHLEQLTTTADSPTQDHRLFKLNMMLGDIDAAERYFDLYQEYYEKNSPSIAALIWLHRDENERMEETLKASERRLRNRIPRRSESIVQRRLAWIEILRGQHEKALDRMEAMVEKHVPHALLPSTFGRPDRYPPIVRDFVRQPRFRELQVWLDAEKQTMRNELAALDARSR
ncbi:MAG: winged helix-turn-helix domain-containing protein [Wenzhouxiangellaceae bacterium]|nr:winged helix-turn-helix domain-containing protein [Wenzhouxiangellaceae bacterium]